MLNVANAEYACLEKAMGRLAFFEEFSVIHKRRILELHTNFRRVPKGQHVIHEGTNGRSFFLILKGRVAIVKDQCKGHLNELEAGDFFGEIGLVTGRPRTTSVVSMNECLMLEIDQKFLQDAGPEIRERIKDNIIRKLVDRLEHMNLALARHLL